jgi:hypothetical membrane protein
MKSIRRIETFHDRYPLVGPAFWIVSVQYFLAQVIVASAWTQPGYNWATNVISDLGATICGTYGGRIVCSPFHGLMNGSFVVLGATMIAGSGLIYHEFRKSRSSKLGFSLMVIAGLGTMLVGLFPENTIYSLHLLGAGMAFLVSDIALVIFARVLPLSKFMRVYTIISSVFLLLALFLYITNNYFGFGAGTMERLATYPQTIWLIVFAFYISKNHFKQKRFR